MIRFLLFAFILGVVAMIIIAIVFIYLRNLLNLQVHKTKRIMDIKDRHNKDLLDKVVKANTVTQVKKVHKCRRY